MTEFIEKIKESTDIVKEARRYTKLKKRGNRLIGLCPFHDEETPSFTVDKEKQLFHCFGCGAGGDMFALVMEKENIDFSEAVIYLAKKNKIKIPDTILEKVRKQKIQKKELMEKYSKKPVSSFIQFDGFTGEPFMDGNPVGRNDKDGDWLSGCITKELMSGIPDVRVLIPPRVSVEEALRLLKKISKWMKRTKSVNRLKMREWAKLDGWGGTPTDLELKEEDDGEGPF